MSIWINVFPRTKYFMCRFTSFVNFFKHIFVKCFWFDTSWFISRYNSSIILFVLPKANGSNFKTKCLMGKAIIFREEIYYWKLTSFFCSQGKDCFWLSFTHLKWDSNEIWNDWNECSDRIKKNLVLTNRNWKWRKYTLQPSISTIGLFVLVEEKISSLSPRNLIEFL